MQRTSSIRELAAFVTRHQWPHEWRPPVESFGLTFMERVVALAVQTSNPRTPRRWIAYWWTNCGDELAWMDDTGRMAIGQANEWAYLAWKRKHTRELRLYGVQLGNSDEPAVHCILWDRQTGLVYVTLREQAELWLEAINQAMRNAPDLHHV